MHVEPARTQRDLDGVRRLMRLFVEWHYTRHAEDRALIDAYFDPVSFERELADLPGMLGPPDGRLLVARVDDEVMGCVGLHPIGEDACEMKRLFVDPRAHGSGMGLALAEAIIAEAKAMGFAKMYLDTGPQQSEAQGLYARLGFVPTAPYYDMGAEMRNWLVFMERDLAH